MQYPGLHRAFYLIALDNGGINRDRTKERQQREATKFLTGRIEPLEEIDAYLAGLTDEELDEICNGDRESDEGIALRAAKPPPLFMEDVLDAYFNEVC